MARRMKVFSGNLDGRNRGLVAATSQKEAAAIAGTSLYDFRNYWSEASNADDILFALGRPGRLFKKPYNHEGTPWMEG